MTHQVLVFARDVVHERSQPLERHPHLVAALKRSVKFGAADPHVGLIFVTHLPMLNDIHPCISTFDPVAGKWQQHGKRTAMRLHVNKS